MIDSDSLAYQLVENPHETYYISKFVHEAEEEINVKIINAMIKLLIDGFLKNASYENIKECFELLIIHQNEDINWDYSTEVNDLLEKYF
ncbi:MAG: hypothetical protein BZ138_08050 [Methanosphaera sp. rholeuAM270]|nr:MAG: hypothetical protein BZ138_08050 [Methanosphaera sp. rholeuAM270]